VLSACRHEPRIGYDGKLAFVNQCRKLIFRWNGLQEVLKWTKKNRATKKKPGTNQKS
jgi:hypothetical protein